MLFLNKMLIVKDGGHGIQPTRDSTHFTYIRLGKNRPGGRALRLERRRLVRGRLERRRQECRRLEPRRLEYLEFQTSFFH